MPSHIPVHVLWQCFGPRLEEFPYYCRSLVVPLVAVPLPIKTRLAVQMKKLLSERCPMTTWLPRQRSQSYHAAGTECCYQVENAVAPHYRLQVSMSENASQQLRIILR